MNLLLSPSDFTDSTSSPPACWNGTSYVVANSPVTLRYTGTVHDGDTMDFDGSSVLGTTTVLVTYEPA